MNIPFACPKCHTVLTKTIPEMRSCPTDGLRFERLSKKRIHTKNTHGTGCTFSAAISSFLARGCSPYDAVIKAKDYVTLAIAAALRQDIGHGHGPVDPFLGQGRRPA